MLRARKKKEKQTTKFTSVTYVWSWLRGLEELQISYSWNNSESSPKAPYTVIDFLQLNKLAKEKNNLMHAFWSKGNKTE